MSPFFVGFTKDNREIKTTQFSPRVRRLRGIISVEEYCYYKKVLVEELSKKYGV